MYKILDALKPLVPILILITHENFKSLIRRKLILEIFVIRCGNERYFV